MSCLDLEVAVDLKPVLRFGCVFWGELSCAVRMLLRLPLPRCYRLPPCINSLQDASDVLCPGLYLITDLLVHLLLKETDRRTRKYCVPSGHHVLNLFVVPEPLLHLIKGN